MRRFQIVSLFIFKYYLSQLYLLTLAYLTTASERLVKKLSNIADSTVF